MDEMIGLFFGSFNPIHNGHMTIARYLLDAGYCGEIWFVVSPRNPLKEEGTLLDEKDRFEIVRRAVEQEPRMRVCDIEFSMPRPSYTIDTLRVISAKYPEEKFALVIGGDNLKNFHRWKDYREIAAGYPILVYPRPGIIPEGNDCGTNVILTEAPMSELSSTDIRQRVREGKDIRESVPSGSLDLILKLYGS